MGLSSLAMFSTTVWGDKSQRGKKMQKTGPRIHKLAEKIYRELGVRCDPDTFGRTRAGKWQLRHGACSWEMKDDRGRRICSRDNVGECLRGDRVLEWEYVGYDESMITAEERL